MSPALSFITLLLAAIVAWVGYQQYILARARFKLDLFDKRFAVYKATQIFLCIILGAARFEMGEFWEFRRDTQDAPFLFRDDIVQFLEAIDKAALDLGLQQNVMSLSPSVMRGCASSTERRLC